MTTLPAITLAFVLPMAAPADEPPATRLPQPDFSREIRADRSYLIPAAEIVGFDVLLNLFDRAYFGCCDFHVTTESIRRNLRSSWVVDRDPFLVNQFGHPYQGSMYHGFARASGLTFWEGMGYTFLGSAFWEIAGEATPPSRNDQVTTGIGGSFLGEALFRMANLVLERDPSPGWWRGVMVAAISPPMGFNRLAFRDRFDRPFPSRDPLFFTRFQVGFSGTAQESAGVSTTKLRRNEGLADFYLEYGLPGKRAYEYTRPFDYFAFQATASTANGFENVLTRGLVKGKAYEWGDDYRGVLGLYGHYDYIAPQTFRVSTTSLGLGTTGQWWLGRHVALQSTLLGSLGYGAGGVTRGEGVGEVDPATGEGERDYHYGMTPQGLIAARLIVGDRLSIDTSIRDYYVSRIFASESTGQENIFRADISVTLRVWNLHGLTVRYVDTRRNAHYDDVGPTRQGVGAISIVYSLLGQTRFGAVDWRPASEGGPLK